MEASKGLKKYEKLNRKEYFEKNQELAKYLWQEPIPTVSDICDYIKGKENKVINNIFEFYKNQEEFDSIIKKTENNYDQDESSTFIRKVMASNNSDISEAGYFYKLLMASADDLTIEQTNNCKMSDCGSEGVSYTNEEIDIRTFNYRIKFNFIIELNDFCEFNFEDFLSWMNENNIKEIHVRTPLTCNYIQNWKNTNKCLCRKCVGKLPQRVKSIGAFTTLMVTESATQAALSSMNKGRKKNINNLLTQPYDGSDKLEEIKTWISSIVSDLNISDNPNVSSRFFEIALLSRIRKDTNDRFFVSGMKPSIKQSDNIFGSYIFTPNMKTFETMINKGEFEDDSLKLKIAINHFN